MSLLLTRRRFIGIAAAAGGLGLIPVRGSARAETHLVTWTGHVMGAVATMQIHHHDRDAAERLIERSIAQVHRLETVFSLYRADSALSILNRQGMLVAPPAELVELLTECRRYSELTGGAFDPTVQALWVLYRDHFSTPGADSAGPAEAVLQAARTRVGFQHVVFDRNRITFARRGTGLTLNGIAQGYATDAVVQILRDAGMKSSVVDMGESRALGARPGGAPWRVGIAAPDHPDQIGEILDVKDRAVATSGAYGFRFDPAGRFNHLLDPRTGTSAYLYRSVSAIMPTATAADALSTAFSLMPAEEISSTLRSLGAGEVRLIDAKGERLILTA